MSTKNRTTTHARDAHIIAGIGKRLEPGQTVLLLGTAYTPDELTELYQSQIDSAATLATLRAQLADQLAVDRALAKKLDVLTRAMKGFVENTFGSTSAAFGDFGFVANKPTGTRDPATQVVAAAKAKATREARGTMGKRQRERILGIAPARVTIAVGPAGKPSGAVAVGAGAVAPTSAEPLVAKAAEGPPPPTHG
jgi:hypothetical protein